VGARPVDPANVAFPQELAPFVVGLSYKRGVSGPGSASELSDPVRNPETSGAAG